MIAEKKEQDYAMMPFTIARFGGEEEIATVAALDELGVVEAEQSQNGDVRLVVLTSTAELEVV